MDGTNYNQILAKKRKCRQDFKTNIRGEGQCFWDMYSIVCIYNFEPTYSFMNLNQTTRVFINDNQIY